MKCHIHPAYLRAAKAGKCESVLRFDSQCAPHPPWPAKDQDPAGHELIASLWERNPAR